MAPYGAEAGRSAVNASKPLEGAKRDLGEEGTETDQRNPQLASRARVIISQVPHKESMLSPSGTDVMS
jgi:hypothetical protein